MTTPTDPTTLRTALDALRYLSDAATNILNTKTADPLFPVRVVDLSRANADAQDVIIAALATPAPAADYPGPKPFPPGCICGTDNLTDDCTAHPAPAADEARCVACGLNKNYGQHDPGRSFPNHPFQRTPAPAADEARCFEGVAALHAGIPTVVTCGEPRDSETHEPGAPDYDHPFQPAPTPAPPTPPATEERVTHGRHCRCTPCRREDWTNPNLAHCGMHGPSCPPVYAPIDLTPPATEPVAALGLCQWTPTTEPCLGDPDDWRHRRCLPEGDPCPDPCPAMPGCHPYTPVAARAEVDVERLARALHDQGFGCNAYRCSLGRGSSADAHEQDARFLAAAYREHPDDR